jgi:hypothetical protein
MVGVVLALNWGANHHLFAGGADTKTGGSSLNLKALGNLALVAPADNPCHFRFSPKLGAGLCLRPSVSNVLPISVFVNRVLYFAPEYLTSL